MLDPIIAFFERIFTLIGHGIGVVIAWILWPFMAATRWYRHRGFVLKTSVGGLVLILVVLYAIFIWRTLWIRGLDPDYIRAYNPGGTGCPGVRSAVDREQFADHAHLQPLGDCRRDADLIEFNVDQNVWLSSTLLYKAGFFGLPWDSTPYLDNKASFQRGVHQAVQRTAVELVDALGRVRGTSAVDEDLARARGRIQYDQYTWYFSTKQFGFLTPTPEAFREGRDLLRTFNDKLEACDAVFDARADT